MNKSESNPLYDDSSIGKAWNPEDVESFAVPATERLLTEEEKRILGSRALGSEVLLDGGS